MPIFQFNTLEFLCNLSYFIKNIFLKKQDFAPWEMEDFVKIQNTVFWRILLIFSVLVIPWMVVSIILLNAANARIVASNVSLVQQSRKNVLENIEEQIQNIALAARAGNTLDNTFYLSVLDQSLTGYDRVQVTDQIFESLNLIIITHSWTENARIYSRPLDLCFSSSNINHVNSSGVVRAVTDEEFERIAGLLQDGNVLTMLDGSVVFLIPNSQLSPICVLEVELSEYQLSQYLTASLEYPSDSLFSLCLQDDKFWIGNITEDDLYDAALSAVETAEAGKLTDFSFGSGKYWLYVYRSAILGFTYFELIPKKILTRPAGLSVALLITFISLSAVVIVIFFIQSVKLIHHPLQDLINSFDRLRQGDLSVRAEKPETEDFNYLYDSFNHMASELEQLVSQNYKQQILLQKAELRQLQAQINPHFLYNNFFWLQRVISSGDIEQAEQITQDLGMYFRYITRSNSDIVPLFEENEHAMIYSDLQATRFSGRIHVEFDTLPPEFENWQVPKLFMQPLIENAFKYGLEEQLGGGMLRVLHVKKSEMELVIMVEDNGKSLTDQRLFELRRQVESLETDNIPAGLSGMMNIARRLQIYYQSMDCFSLSRSQLGGLCVTIRLYFKEKGGNGNVSWNYCR